MAKARKEKQLQFVMDDRPGLLSDIAAAIAAAKVNIVASCAYAMNGKAEFMLITDGNAKAKKAIAKMGAAVKEESVIALEMSNKPGEMQKAAQKIAAAGVNINYTYGTAFTGKTCTAILSTADDAKALKALAK